MGSAMHAFPEASKRTAAEVLRVGMEMQVGEVRRHILNRRGGRGG
jgi:hypothetical protein